MFCIVGLNVFELDVIQLVLRKVKRDVCVCVEKLFVLRKVNYYGSVELLFMYKLILFYCYVFLN